MVFNPLSYEFSNVGNLVDALNCLSGQNINSSIENYFDELELDMGKDEHRVSGLICKAVS